MRFGWIAAAAAMVCAVPAGAATIVQTDTEAVMAGFRGFDSRLGTLNSATLDISISKYRGWQIDAAQPVGTVKRVDYVVDGIWSLRSPAQGQTTPFLVALTGSGTNFVTLTSAFSDRAAGLFTVAAFGAATVNLDPTRFIDRDSAFDGNDNGYFDETGADTTLTAAGANRFLHFSGACGASNGVPVFRLAEDACGNVSYRLTYDYTPVTAPVPEPATWALMLIGLGGIGFAMRRRSNAASSDCKRTSSCS